LFQEEAQKKKGNCNLKNIKYSRTHNSITEPHQTNKRIKQ